jgi:glycosyltransferase involved in cell wall biosynthesis
LELKVQRAETFTVLYVGKPSYTKGFDLFAAVSELVTGSDIRFVAVGPPDRKFDGGGRVDWVGYIPHEEMWKTYARASVLLHPTRQETSGRAILESLAAGTPVITTPIPCHRSFQLPLDYASTLAEMASKVEEHYRRWKDDSSEQSSAQRAAASVARFDSNILLPRYERMLTEVLENDGS